MGTERILVMNLGSTSSKIAVYDDDKEVFNDTIRHTTEELAPFGDVTEQYEFRYNKIRESMAANGVSMDSLTAAVSRGGNILPDAELSSSVLEKWRNCKASPHPPGNVCMENASSRNFQNICIDAI